MFISVIKILRENQNIFSVISKISLVNNPKALVLKINCQNFSKDRDPIILFYFPFPINTNNPLEIKDGSCKNLRYIWSVTSQNHLIY
mgnify:CR=1 FL=1